MDVDDEELAQLKKSKAAHRMATITGEIVERQTGIESINPSRWPRINSRLLGKAFTRWLITDERFRVDDTRCRQCGLCRQVCPVGNISGGKGEHPQWLHTGRCLTCFACYHHCPAHAIDWGRETRGKGQYHYCDKE
jgi:NAD-dependent dihydropyrimidine dehydrogenase PreA subunit